MLDHDGFPNQTQLVVPHFLDSQQYGLTREHLSTSMYMASVFGHARLELPLRDAWIDAWMQLTILDSWITAMQRFCN